MPLKFKIETKEQGDRHDIEVNCRKFKLYFMEKYATIQLMGDILVGISFLTGSILNLIGTPSVYGNGFYLIGSLSLIVRPTIKIIRRTWIYNNDENDT
ncbi:hypothetical protein F3157_11075 [Virgibacillus dakarensis]|uniref:YrhK domain-containing protein n=1 Tax=Lentibacillus populi TaxID=1827502 RepID=A0A9W5X4V5_9BACI|nr:MULTISPECIES: YrhK family protein [Bacillaceae]MTW86198.1 hypothetical protein [Virgibacillus dakarensis]GGB38498.1 hypothetical protein GCM10011409_14980 [Lentibacillus populi]